MSVTVLLSAGRHPVSGQGVLPRLEAQAIRLVADMDDVTGLHAGVDTRVVSDALGHGLARLTHLVTGADADPIPYLVAELQRAGPRLVVAGRRSQGGEETGLVPYALARALSMPLVADAILVAPGATPDTLIVEQALPRGERRRVEVRTPVIVTVHPTAPAPRPFAYGQMRRGRTDTVTTPDRRDCPLAPVACQERTYRPRPKMLKGADAAASASERLKAVSGAADGAATNVLVRPDPTVAAREILAFLRRVGVRPTHEKA